MITSDKKELFKKCYLCDSPDLKTFYEEKGIVKCRECNFIFFNPFLHLVSLIGFIQSMKEKST